MSEKSTGWAKIEEWMEKRLENSSKTAGPSGRLGVCVCECVFESVKSVCYVFMPLLMV